ncbi:hypothetical protein P1J78_04115 [Psychromarinibacter sp. C21-152]|uniref:Uncharacterized protein n=1 Tax=Psychromarinibacter sediminicola TaxID=3033385 RepID=A0AAE3NS27_9RHOB|nr:hypothetical protein [Psychromarinibacter sediminicola]MDF0599910.1 hypothetical protein [Psychromarinibacter sediminicola]
MRRLDDIVKADCRDVANAVAYDVDGLILCARLALDPMDGSVNADQRAGAIERTLEVAAMLMEVVLSGTEGLERDAKRGLWAKPRS